MKTKLPFLFIGILSFANLTAQPFSAKTLVTATNDNVGSIAFEDIDQDGDIDIMCTSSTSNHVFWYKNLGNEIFSAKILINSSYTGPRSISILDVDEDGKNDLVVAEPASGVGISWIKNMGGGFFGGKQSLPYCGICSLSNIKVGDVNNDGKKDIIVAELSNDVLSWVRNNGNGSFESMGSFFVSSGTNIHSYEFADTDQDQVQDLIVSTGGVTLEKIIQFEYVGNAFVQTPIYESTSTPWIYESYVQDMDNDGKQDIVTASTDCSLYWFKNFGANVFSGLNSIGLSSCSLGDMSDAGDLDLDGNGDLIYFKNANLYWRHNLGGSFDSTLSNISVGAISGNISDTLLRDIDNDGDLDIFYTSANEFGWFKNDKIALGNNQFSQAQFSVFPNPVNSELNITSKTAFSNFKVYDVNGRLLQNTALSVPATEYQVDLGNLTSGVYLLEIQAGNVKQTQKFVKK